MNLFSNIWNKYRIKWDTDNNYVSQNTASSNGASAFYLSANGGLTYASSDYKTAFGVITTNSNNSSGGEQLEEVFSVSKSVI